MVARIFKPAKTAMQSGRGNTKEWILEFEPDRKIIDPLMGWTGSADTRTQVRLRFDSKDEAIAYAQKKGIPYDVEEPKQRLLKPKAYSDNFAYDRIGRWTH